MSASKGQTSVTLEKKGRFQMDLYPMKEYLIQEASGLAHFINQWAKRKL